MVLALPQGHHLSSGQANIKQKDKKMEVTQTSPKTIINWDSFSIGENEHLQFIQPSKEASILNRVTSNDLSKISGLLTGNGKVYLINKNGIIIGPQGKINANAFLGSTLDLSDNNFLSGDLLNFKGDSVASIINKGIVSSLEGGITFIAKDISNEGLLESNNGTVNLSAGNEVLLLENNESKIAVKSSFEAKLENSGIIKAAEAHLKANSNNIYSLAVNHSGYIEARGTVRKGGRVILEGNDTGVCVTGKIKSYNENSSENAKIHITGKTIHLKNQAIIEASSSNGGGEILIGGNSGGQGELKKGDSLIIDKEVSIQADCLERGDGGQVVLFANKLTSFEGTISAKGGVFEGNGGLIEISSKETFSFRGNVSTKSPNGTTGTLLLAPCDASISTGSSSPIHLNSNSGYPNYFPTTTTAILNNKDLQNTLENNNIIICTSFESDSKGSIKISAPITWKTPTTLTLQAAHIISITDNISNTYTGQNTPWNAVVFTGNGLGSITGYSGLSLSSAFISSAEGNILLTGTGDNYSGCHGINLFGGEIKATGKANITIDGYGGNHISNNLGIYLDGSLISSENGDILLRGTGGNSTGNMNHGININMGSTVVSSGLGNIFLEGRAGKGIDNNCGIRIYQSSKVNTTSGNIYLSTSSPYATTGSENEGIFISKNSNVQSLSGNISIDAISSGGLSHNHALFLCGVNSFIKTTSGNILITVASKGTTNNNCGLELEDTYIASDSGNISVICENKATAEKNCSCIGVKLNGSSCSNKTGNITIKAMGKGLNDKNHGIYLEKSSFISSSGKITIDVAAEGDGASGVFLQSSNILETGLATIAITDSSKKGITTYSKCIIGGPTCSGDIQLTSNSFSFNANSIIQGRGNLTIQPNSFDLTLGLGNGAQGALILNNATLDIIQKGFKSITFGRNDSVGNVHMTSYTYNAPVTVQGGSINVDGSVNTGTHDLTLNIGRVTEGTLNLEPHAHIKAAAFTMNGGVKSNTFNIQTTSFDVTSSTLAGGNNKGKNTLISPRSNNIWTLTSPDSGNLLIDNHTTIRFSNIQHLCGNDRLDILKGPSSGSFWRITGKQAGDFGENSLSFINMNKLIGGSSGNDTFAFITEEQFSHDTNAIDGGGGYNTLIGPNASNTWTLTNLTSGKVYSNKSNPTEFTSIHSLVGNAGLDILMGPSQGSFWRITGAHAGDFGENSLCFANMNKLIGGSSGNDTFAFITEEQFSSDANAIDGNGGNNNTLIGPNSSNLWTITKSHAGNIAFPKVKPTSFTNIQNLVGNNSNDTFRLNDGIKFAGSIDGRGGINTLNYSNWESGNLNIDIAESQNIQFIVGGTKGTITTLSDSGKRGGNWTINGYKEGNIDNTIKFSSIDHLSSSYESNNNFHIEPGGIIDSIRGNGKNNTYYLHGGDVTKEIGGNGNNNFVFDDGVSITGKVWGSANGKNTLDYSQLTSEVTIDLAKQETPGCSEFQNINNFIGSSATGTLIGKDADQTWNITNINTGNINSNITFSNISKLEGGHKNDTFNIIGDGKVSAIDGKTGNNSLSKDVGNNTWKILSHNGGDIAGVQFTNVQNLIGGEGVDTFKFSDATSLSGYIDGKTATGNILDYSSFSSPVKINNTVANLGGGFFNIQVFIGNIILRTPKMLFLSTQYDLVFNDISLDFYLHRTMFFKDPQLLSLLLTSKRSQAK